MEELAAQKIKTCIERAEPRDIYDLSCLSKQALTSRKTRKYIAVYYCMIEKDKTTDAVKRIETYDLDKLHQELKQFIRNNEQLDVENIRRDAAEFLKVNLSFTAKEQQFVNSFYQKQKIFPKLLFKNKPTLVNHPALLYQLEKFKKKQNGR